MLLHTILICIIALGAGVADAIDVQELWSEFKSQFNKTYPSTKESSRLSIFSRNLDAITEHNERADQGLETFYMGVNEFADLTFEEFASRHLGLKVKRSLKAPKTHVAVVGESLPDSFDWREKGVVADVKDQGSCGSCWSFSAVSSLESANALATGKLVRLSEQNLMDCSWLDGNVGCKGGWMGSAYDWAVRHGGVQTEESYPYTGKDSLLCKFKKTKLGGIIKSYALVEGADNMKSAVIIAPLAVAIEADTKFQLYKSGIFSSSECKGTFEALNHAVNIVGYGTYYAEGHDGTTPGTDYWIVKNSWGTTWGEDGFSRVLRGVNQCCIECAAFYPVVK